jgi:hypothetical protein
LIAHLIKDGSPSLKGRLYYGSDLQRFPSSERSGCAKIKILAFIPTPRRLDVDSDSRASKYKVRHRFITRTANPKVDRHQYRCGGDFVFAGESGGLFVGKRKPLNRVDLKIASRAKSKEITKSFFRCPHWRFTGIIGL